MRSILSQCKTFIHSWHTHKHFQWKVSSTSIKISHIRPDKPGDQPRGFCALCWPSSRYISYSVAWGQLIHPHRDIPEHQKYHNNNTMRYNNNNVIIDWSESPFWETQTAVGAEHTMVIHHFSLWFVNAFYLDNDRKTFNSSSLGNLRWRFRYSCTWHMDCICCIIPGPICWIRI